MTQNRPFLLPRHHPSNDYTRDILLSMSELDRRQLLTGAAAAAAAELLPGNAESGETQFLFKESSLSQADLEKQQGRAIDSLQNSIPLVKELQYLREHAKDLKDESQMYLPSSSEVELVEKNSRIQVEGRERNILHEFAEQIPTNQTGLFIFADVDNEGKNFQRLYVLRKESNNQIRFEKAYRVSMAEKGFGDDENSYKTPLGFMRVLSGKIGMFGEVVTAKLENPAGFFNRVILNGRTHWFMRNLDDSPNENLEIRRARDRAEVVTDRYTVDEQRGIHIHGTNRSGRWIIEQGRRIWQTFLGGRRRSGGCIRMSNTDVRDLGLSGYILLPTVARVKGKKQTVAGTAVMIHATPAAMRGGPDSSQTYGTDYGKRRPLPEDPITTKEKPHLPEIPKVEPAKKFTPPPRRKLPEDK